MTKLTDSTIVQRTNALARKFFTMQGWAAPTDYKFYEHKASPRARQVWNMACEASIELTATDPEDALSNLEES